MSLIDPSIGHLLDRLSILKLKIEHGEAAHRPIGHFRIEQAEILTRLPSDWQTKVDRIVTRLFAVNELLWHETDAFRLLAKTNHVVEQARMGLSILRLNDERSHLIEDINTVYGDYRKEKLA